MTIDTTKLRELAQKATPGPWTYFPYPKYKEHHVSLPIDGSGMTMPLFPDGCQTSRQREDAEYIAAANPSTVLALLDKLDGTESMFLAACADLGAINKLLGLDPDDGGAEPILYEVKRLLAIEAAARNMAKVKGRHNTEIAMNRLLETLK